jgi:HSP90 family molecular chaperone
VLQSAAYKGADEKPLEIHIQLDNAKKTLTVQDFGIGMTADELVSNLGTIARSGSKAYKDLACKWRQISRLVCVLACLLDVPCVGF